MVSSSVYKFGNDLDEVSLPIAPAYSINNSYIDSVSSASCSSLIKRLQSSNEIFQKAPFLPRLPEKIFSTYRINSAHLINNNYVECQSKKVIKKKYSIY